MTTFTAKIKPYVEHEIKQAVQAEQNNDPSTVFTHLENAHVLGQQSTYWHVKIHWLMFVWGYKNKQGNEMFGQLIRMIGAACLTAIKGVPAGNTGGANVSMIKPMPLRREHAEILAKLK